MAVDSPISSSLAIHSFAFHVLHCYFTGFIRAGLQQPSWRNVAYDVVSQGLVPSEVKLFYNIQPSLHLFSFLFSLLVV
jgi:uncharacterized protein YgfB (UPF0149 family)